MRGRIVYRTDGDHYFVDNREVTKEEFDILFPDAPSDESTGEPGSSLCGWKPIVSDALAVHPRQVEEATLDAAKKGCPTEFLPDGRPILTSRSHRKQYLKSYGFHDRRGGYGD